jgi:hypothetical protein
MHGGEAVRPSDAMVAQGPWLVLDSIPAADAERVGTLPRLGTLLERRDTLERTGGRWDRIAPDSIVFTELSTFPSVTWRLRQSGDELRGTGVLVHDAVAVDRDGVARRSVSRWPVVIRRISCADVPR